jgi:cell division protein ZapA (FtsZ GTPase activity inhibitor)
MGKGIPIHVLGSSFSIQTDESPEYVESLVSYVTTKVEALQRSIDTKDNLRLVVLAAVLIADELFKERDGTTKTSDEAGDLGDLTESIIARLDEALEK